MYFVVYYVVDQIPIIKWCDTLILEHLRIIVSLLLPIHSTRKRYNIILHHAHIASGDTESAQSLPEWMYHCFTSPKIANMQKSMYSTSVGTCQHK